MARALSRAPRPRQLHYPLATPTDHLEPTVAPGDRVVTGDVVAVGARGPSHTAAAGEVTSIDAPRPLALPGAAAVPTITIETAASPSEPRRLDTRGPLADLVERAGIVGLGGGGYPAHLKIRSALAHGADTVVANGVECERGVHADAALMAHHADGILRGAEIVRDTIGAQRVVVAVGEDNTDTIDLLRAAAGAASFELLTQPPGFASGAERALVQRLTDTPLPPERYPTEAGFVVFNVATLYAIHRAADVGEPLTQRVVTLGPDAVDTWVAIGHPFAELDLTGPLWCGGRWTGWPTSPGAAVTKTTHAVTTRSQPAAYACIRCNACAEVCPASLLPQELFRVISAQQWPRAAALDLDACIECGACVAACPSHIPLLDSYRHAKSVIAERRQAEARAATAKAHFEAHEHRRRSRAEAAAEKRERRLASKRRWDDV